MARAPTPVAGLLAFALCVGCGPHMLVRGGRVNDDAVEMLRREVAANRGLVFLRPVPVIVQSTEEFTALVERDASDGQDRAAERVLVRLGLLASASDGASQAADWVARAAAVYNPYNQTVVLLREKVREQPPLYPWLPGVVDPVQMTLAHELTHALQDQHWPRLPAPPPFSDRMLAENALREGDAVLSALTCLRPQGPVPETGSDGADVAPLPEETSLLPALGRFLYRDGPRFVARTLAAGGWRAVDSLYRTPLSTAWILHPERAAEAPIEVKFGGSESLEAAGWSRVRDAPVGELLIRQLARQLFPAARASSIADGWGGDTLRAFSRGDELELVWRSTWDSPADAAQFAGALPELVPGAFVERRDGEVLALIGPVTPQAALATAVWASSGGRRPE